MEIIPLNHFFEHPEQWEGKEVALRGFLYNTEKGQALLALEPNIPSCCVGKKDKSFVILKGDFSGSSSRASVIEGKITKDASHWMMVSPQLIEEQKMGLSWLFLPLATLIFVCIMRKSYYSDRKTG